MSIHRKSDSFEDLLREWNIVPSSASYRAPRRMCDDKLASSDRESSVGKRNLPSTTMGTTRARHSVELSRNHWLRETSVGTSDHFCGCCLCHVLTSCDNSRLSAVEERARLQQLLYDPRVAHGFQITEVHNEEYDEWTPVSQSATNTQAPETAVNGSVILAVSAQQWS